MKRFISKSEKDTINFAKKFATTLKGGEILSLEGDLGAGKTVFTKGLAQGLGIKKIIKSPTFVLMKVFAVNHKTIENLIHIDAYRLNNFEELKDIGLEDFLNHQNIVVVEWGGKFLKDLTNNGNCIRIKIRVKNNKERNINIS